MPAIERLSVMLLAATRWIVVLLVAASAASCGSRSAAPAVVPASTAYSDGFEVVVFDMRDGVPSNVRSLHLKEAEQAIAAGAQASIPGDPAAVQEKLSAGKSGDYHVLLTAKPLEAGKQQVRLAFHESKRTYVYEYAVTGTRIVPLSSEYRDLARSEVVRYSGE